MLKRVFQIVLPNNLPNTASETEQKKKETA
jgi:hypothetical protein